MQSIAVSLKVIAKQDVFQSASTIVQQVLSGGVACKSKLTACMYADDNNYKSRETMQQKFYCTNDHKELLLFLPREAAMLARSWG